MLALGSPIAIPVDVTPHAALSAEYKPSGRDVAPRVTPSASNKPAAPTGATEQRPDAAYEAQWNADAALRNEFTDFKNYMAYARGVEEGHIKAIGVSRRDTSRAALSANIQPAVPTGATEEQVVAAYKAQWNCRRGTAK